MMAKQVSARKTTFQAGRNHLNKPGMAQVGAISKAQK